MQAAYARNQTGAAPWDSAASKPESWSDAQWALVEPLLPDYTGDAGAGTPDPGARPAAGVTHAAGLQQALGGPAVDAARTRRQAG